MGQKKDTLLRWVECCSDSGTSVDRIKNLSDGRFFVHILSFLNGHSTDTNDPWLQTINVLREYKLQENVIDYDLAASGNEDELAKLIVICMHLTMVQKPCEVIKEKTMWNLSTEDQKVIETILLAIVNDDQLTRSRLVEVLQDLQETSLTKTVMFYTSSPLSSLSKNSPLKRFLDSPMALRLTRLQKEISDKNEEIRRLQSDLLTESDETSALSSRMDDMKRKIKELEKKNAELEQRLRDCQIPDSVGNDSDIEIIQLKKQIKKMQNEYESSCQKYCDLNMEYDALKTRQEKDRKQIRQLQLDLNETVARFERESAQYQLLLDSIRTENVELKHALEEKAQWIDVLEEKSRSCSELHARFSAPRSPCERESIGYSLLSMEAEKLQDELETYRRNLTRQSEKFDSEKRLLEKRTAALEEEKLGLHQQVEKISHTNQALQEQLTQANSNFEQLSHGCNSLTKENEKLRLSLAELQTKFQNEMSRAQQQLDIRCQKAIELGQDIESLNRQLHETNSAKNKFEMSLLEQSGALEELERLVNNLRLEKEAVESSYSQQIQLLKNEKQELLLSQSQLEEQHASLAASSLALRKELEQRLTNADLKLLEHAQLLQQANTSRKQAERQVETLNETLSKLELDLKLAVEEKCQLANEIPVLQAVHGEMKNLESAVEQLTADIEELSCKKNNLERLRQVLENAKANAEFESSQLRQQLESKEVTVTQLSFKIDMAESELEQSQREKQVLKDRITELEFTISSLNNSYSETSLIVQNLEKQLLEREASMERLKKDLVEDKDRLIQAQISLTNAMSELQTSNEAKRQELETTIVELKLKFDDERLSIQDRITELESTVLTLNNSTTESAKLIQTLEKQLQERETALEKTNAELVVEKEQSAQAQVSFTKAMSDLQASNDNKRQELETIIADLKRELNTEKLALQERISELESTVLTLNNCAAETSQVVQNLEKQLKEQETTLERTNVELLAEKKQSTEAQVSLTKAMSDLQVSNDSNQRELETTITELKRELDIEKQLASEQAISIQTLTLARKDACELADSLRCKLAEVESELTKLIESEAQLKLENERLDEEMNSKQRQFEREKADTTKSLENAEKHIEQLTLQLETVSSSHSDMEKECNRLRADQQNARDVKAHVEQMSREVEAKLQSTTAKLQSQLDAMELELKSKSVEIIELSNSTNALNLKLQITVEEKETLERNFIVKLSDLNSEKENLFNKHSSLEQEIRELKAELAAEKNKTLQGKGEINLEHRKEKAALEARLQVAQSQMKSMQEKLVNMTVANNSQAPLEHKISMLTNELEAANKARSELEKQLAESKLRVKEEITYLKEEIETCPTKIVNEDDNSELAILRKKYENAKKALAHKDDVIGQYASKFEKMQNQLDTLNEEVASANLEKNKLKFENRSLKNEQQHLLAQLAAEKDKADARITKHSQALQRGNSTSDGGTLADTLPKPSLRSYRSEMARQQPGEVFRPPSLAFGDGSDANSIFKVPPSRRDSSSSICSNRSDISITSRGQNVPQGAGRLFTCDDEDGELFSSSYLNEMKEGKCRVQDSSARVSELHRRNTMQPPHMRSAYPAEMNDERLRQNDMTIYEQSSVTSSKADNQNESLQQLSLATSRLSMHTPPAMNTRKRRSSSWNQSEMETPTMLPRKRRSHELDADMSSDSNDTRSFANSAERKKHRDASQTSYQRPGPPTPSRNAPKENMSTPSIGSTPAKAVSKSTKPVSKRTSPAQGSKNARLTPAALVKKVHAKIRSNMQSSSENTPSRTTPRGSKMNIFRKPLGSRSHNSSDAKN